eukprot:TRINITY_DN937_c0_g1_i1.p2 TRINITY_DN937_c0_g1~~TRINITY_DN937_c0_g1_i1.p2  ORF type:complete len:314 (+),score=66.56 TRINITY_DN937_c0_g1_i1:140-1081(+)
MCIRDSINAEYMGNKKTSKLIKMKKILIIGGIAVSSLGVLYGLHTNYSKLKDQKQQEANMKELDRELVLKILKEMQNQFFTKFQNIALMAMNIKEQFRGQIGNPELKEVIEQKSNIFVDVANIEETLYSEWNITQKEFEYACKVQHKNDEEIQNLQKSIKGEYDNACIGQQPDSQCEIPSFLNEEKTLQILGEIMKQYCLSIRDGFTELRNQGEVIDFSNEKVVQQLNQIKMDEIKKQIIIDQGLGDLKEPGSKILSFATQTYSRSNKNNFLEKMKSIEQVHQAIMQGIFADPALETSYIEQQFQAAFEKVSQ